MEANLLANLEDGIVRLGHYCSNASGFYFAGEPHVNILPDGNKLIRSSTWSDFQTQTYVMEMDVIFLYE